MPWKESSPVEERVRFIADYREGSACFAELCARYGVKPPERVQVGPSLRGGRACRFGGAIATTAYVQARDAARAGGSTSGAAAASPELGAAWKDDVLRSAQATWAGGESSSAEVPKPSWTATHADGRTERGVDGGLQGAVQDPGRGVLLPAHGGGRL